MLLRTILMLVLTNIAITNFAQEPKLMLPIGHTSNVILAIFSPDGKKILTASWDGTTKIWDGLTGKLLVDLVGHRSSITSANFSPDGKRVVTASRDSTSILWDATTGKVLGNMANHTQIVNSANFSLDGKKILTTSWDGTTKIWDALTCSLLINMEGHKSGVTDANFSPDGKRVVTASDDKTAKFWDAETGELLHSLEGHKDGVNSAVFSPDGKRVVTASDDNTAKFWDAETGKLLHNLEGHTDRVESAIFSSDGNKVVTASRDETAKLWNVATGKLLHSLEGHTRTVSSAIFSSDGNKVVTASWDRTARLWDVATGKLLNNLEGHISFVSSAVFSSDGKRVVTASDDKTAKIWDVVTGRLSTSLEGHTTYVNQANFSLDGKKIVTVESSEVNSAKIWDAAANRLLFVARHKDYIFSANFSPDSKMIVTASDDKTAKIWNVTTGELHADLVAHKFGVIKAIFSLDGKRVITASSDKTVKIWDVETGNLLIDMVGHKSGVADANFSPDGKKVVTSSGDMTAKIWDVTTGKMLINLEGHTSSINKANFSPDGKRVVTVSLDNYIRIWDEVNGKLLANLTGHRSYISSIYFSLDGSKIVTASWDSTSKIWDAARGKLLVELKGHLGGIQNANFSPDGKKVVTASGDQTAKIWDVVTGKLIANLVGHKSYVNFSQFNPDGKTIITSSSDNTCKLWDAQTGKLLYTFFAVDSTDYLVVDAQNRYNGTPGARKLLYFTCDDEVIELDQVKDQLWVPNLAERIMKGETINAKTLSELNICGLVPLVEEKDKTNNQYQFSITPRKGGLGETVLYVNGIESKRYQTKDLQQKGSSYTLTISNAELQNYFVSGQENKVSLKAYIKDNTISSRGATLLASNTEKSIATVPNLYAVMVGVNDYKGTELDLKFAAKDANDLSDALGYASRKLLNTDGKEHVFMYNLTTTDKRYQLPEKNSIKKVLEDVGKKATANDILLLFFAGHGVTGGNGNNDKQFYFLTADASKTSAIDAFAEVGISTAELSDWIKPQNLKAQKRILIFDACNSGQAIKDFVALGQQGQNYIAARDDEKAKQIKAIDKLNEKSGLFILSASASNQVAYEMGRYSQGMLTYALLSTIKQQPDILQDGKYLDISRWFGAAEKMVTDLVKENGARQQPQIVSTTNFNIGIVDDEVRAKIILPQEKPLFTNSNLQNASEDIAYDDKGLSKILDKQLFDVSSRGTNSSIVYTPSLQTDEAWVLSGRYDIKGNEITVRVNLRQGKAAPAHKFELKGSIEKLEDLANAIVLKATSLVK
jgi:WD40 repeat protein/uncharacterized caspase-like protein